MNEPAFLFDTNVWVAAYFVSHPHHAAASAALDGLTPTRQACFCRATEQSFLRLLSTRAVMRTYGAEGLSNHDAITALSAFAALPTVTFRGEAPGTFDRWLRLADVATSSPKLWMDAYLAAFAIAGGLTFVTFDKAFMAVPDLKPQLLST